MAERYIRDIVTGEYRWITDNGPKRIVYGRAEMPTRRGPYVVPDIEPFISPIDGNVVSGRRQKRDHMRRHDVEEIGNQKAKPHKYVEMPAVGPMLAEEFKRRGIIG